jgi:hypothetical protein
MHVSERASLTAACEGGGLPAHGRLPGSARFLPLFHGGGGLPAAGELVGLSLFFQLPVAFLLPGNWWACPFSSLFFRLPVAFLLLGNWWACPFSSNCRWPSCCWGTRGPVPFLLRRAPK